MSNRRIEYKDVHPIAGETLRYYVDSRTSQKQHLVDLSEYGGNGRCDCEHFEFKHKKMLEKFGAFPAENLQCWHITRALKFIGQDVVYKVMERVDGQSGHAKGGPKPAPASGRTVRNYVMKP